MSAPTAPCPQDTIDLNSLAAQIAASPDPGAFISQLAMSVAAQSSSAAAQGRMLSMLKGNCERTLKAVRGVLLDSVDEEPGSYDGFVIFSGAGKRAIDYDKLHQRYPAIYSELVSIGTPSLSVKYTG